MLEEACHLINTFKSCFLPLTRAEFMVTLERETLGPNSNNNHACRAMDEGTWRRMEEGSTSPDGDSEP